MSQQQQQPPCTRLRELLLQQQQQQQQQQSKDKQKQADNKSSSSSRSAAKGSSKPLVSDLNKHIVCRLCFGYIVDATTLVECLHTYCRSCIIYRLKNGPKTCPACDTLVTARPQPDVALQRLIYLLVPGLYKSELERRRNFRLPIPDLESAPATSANSSSSSSSEQTPLQGAPDFSFDDLISLSLSRLDAPAATRYLKCPAGVMVRHLQRLLMLKRGWQEDEAGKQSGNLKIEIMHEIDTACGCSNETEFEILDQSWTLMDLACIFKWNEEAPMRLYYRFVPLDEPTIDLKSLSNATTALNDDGNVDATNSAIENIQRPPTPPPSPKPREPPEKSPRPAPTTTPTTTTMAAPLPAPTTTTTTTTTTTVEKVVPVTTAATTAPDPYSKEREVRKTRWATPVTRSPEPPLLESRSRSGKLHRLEHHKRKKRRNKRVIAEITRPPQEDLLKLKVRLTPCPPRVSSSSSQKEKLSQMRAVRKEKTKDEHEDEALKRRPPEEPSLRLDKRDEKHAVVVLEDQKKEEKRVPELDNSQKEDKPTEPTKPSATEKKPEKPAMEVQPTPALATKVKAETKSPVSAPPAANTKVKPEVKPAAAAAASAASPAPASVPKTKPEIKSSVAPPQSPAPAAPVPKVNPVTQQRDTTTDREESPKNEEVLRRLGLVAVSEANRTRQERAKSPSQNKNEKTDLAGELEKLEKQLQESKANRVRSLLAEKQLRDTLKSMMSSKDIPNLAGNSSQTAAASSSSSASSRCATPTTSGGGGGGGGTKRKDLPPLTPLRSNKRPTVTFAPSSFTINASKYESPLDLSSQCKDNVLDLSSGISNDLTIRKCSPDEKLVGILRIGSSGAGSASRHAAEKPREELTIRKCQDSNLRTLSDAAVSLLGGTTAADKARQQMVQSLMAGPGVGPSSAGKVALKIPQPHQRITGFGMKIKPNIGVRHIPNPQAVVASQYRNQRTGFFSLAHQPP